MKWDITLGILILAGAGMLAGAEVGIVQGPIASLMLAAGAITALMFSLMKGKVGAMAGNRQGYATEENEGDRPVRYVRLTQADKEEIVQMIFDKIFAEVGRSFAKKALLIVLSCILALVGWLAKNHIDIK